MASPLVRTLGSNLRKALVQGDLAGAEEILARLKKEDPLSRETRGLELELRLRQNRLEEAGALAEQLCRLFPDSARILSLAGRVAYRQKNYALAEANFRESQRIYAHWQTQHWLGKSLTQLGRFEEAEPLLNAALERSPRVWLDLAWLHERRDDLQAALAACEAYLKDYPGDAFAGQQRLRLRARMIEPDALIEEADILAGMGERVSDALYPDYVRRLFETGQALRAREEITARLESMDARLAKNVAWICYRLQAYDLALSLFLAHLGANHTDYKYLRALETAAARCRRTDRVLEAYRTLLPQAKHLHGRIRFLSQASG